MSTKNTQKTTVHGDQQRMSTKAGSLKKKLSDVRNLRVTGKGIPGQSNGQGKRTEIEGRLVCELSVATVNTCTHVVIDSFAEALKHTLLAMASQSTDSRSP